MAPPEMHRSAAFERAAALAKAKGLALHIVAFDYLEAIATAGMLHPDALQAVREGYLQRHRDWLEEEAALQRSKGLVVTTEVIWVQRPFEEILLHVREMQPAMLVKDVHQEPAFKRIFITPLDWQLLRDCPVPLHLVIPGGHPLPRRVVAAVDPFAAQPGAEALNHEIIQVAQQLAAQCAAELQLVYSYDVAAMYGVEMGMGGLPLSASMADDLLRSQEQAFASLAERHGVPQECRFFLVGSPSQTLPAFAADKQIDVVVLGRVQRRGLEKFLGSTAEHLLYRMPCSMLAIESAGVVGS
ncbi:MAG: universal stress protein [Pseudomonas sp.]